MHLRPLNDTLIIKLDCDEWKYMSKPELIEVPDSVIGAYRKRANSGQVISWGTQCRYQYREGERVFFAKLDHRPGFKLGDCDYRFVSEPELLAKDEDFGS